MKRRGANGRFHRLTELVSYGVATMLLTLPAIFLSAQTRPNQSIGFQYPTQQNELYTQVETFVKTSSIQTELSAIHAIIVPNAPYVYVGSLMGTAYSQLVGRSFDRIIILGQDEHSELPRMYLGANFTSPLGLLRPDVALAEEIVSLCNVDFELVTPDIALPRSIEAQLPFIQYIYGERPILAIGLSNQTPEQALEIGSAIAKALSDSRSGKTLIIAATNLSEFYNSELCEGVDRTSIRKMSSFDFAGIALDLEQGKLIESGAIVLLTMLKASHDNGSDHVQLLRYATSKSLAGDWHPSVGYLSAVIGISREPKVKSLNCISENDGECYLGIAREAIALGLDIPTGIERRIFSDKEVPFDGIYLAIDILDQLRGSSSLFSPEMSVTDAIKFTARCAAFNDPRFNPLSVNEFGEITITLYILSNSRRIDSPGDFNAIENALYIRKGESSTLVLPGDIDPQLGNSEILGRACIRAGLFSNCWRQSETSVYAFDIHLFEEKR